MLTQEEAIACDLAAMAEGRGTTIEQEYRRYQISLILDEITPKLSAERPDVFIGAALAEEPDGAPTIYIKGPADSHVRDLVTAAGIEILIADNQPFSAVEIDDLQGRIGRVLQEVGFTNFSVGNDIRTARFHVAVMLEEGLPRAPDEILALFPSEVRESVDLTVSEKPVAVDTIPE